MDLLNADNRAPVAPPDPQPESDAAPPRSGRTWYRDPLLFLALAAALGLDQLTKWLITSNMAWGQSIPEEQQVRWSQDRKTLIVPVELRPNWLYRMGINSFSFNSFQSEWGVPFDPPVPFTFKTRTD